MPSPVTISIEVSRPRRQVFEYADLAANREAWMRNLYKDWRFEGPRRGVGAIARATPDAPTSRERIEIKVVESEAPERIVEAVDSAHGKRETRTTYRFIELDEGHTKVECEIEWGKTPRAERLVPAVSRAFMARAYGKSLKRLAAAVEKG